MGVSVPGPVSIRSRSLASAGLRLRARVATSVPLRALALSRLLVLCTGTTTALVAPRVGGWAQFDPERLSSSLGTVGNVLAAAAVRWDSIHYLAIAQHAYADPGNTRFFPLYPLLIHAVGLVVGSEPVAGVLISLVAFGVALVLLHRLTEHELGSRAADATVLLLAFAPLSFFFSAVYTESLFLALSLGAVYAARRQQLPLAVALGVLATLARVTGVLLVIPIVLMHLRPERPVDRRLAWVAAMPAAFAGFLAYLVAAGYSLLSPFAGQAKHNHHQFTGPVQGMIAAVQAAAGGVHALLAGSEPLFRHAVAGSLGVGAESILLLCVLATCAVTLWSAFKRLPSAYGAYAGATLLVCLWSPDVRQPLLSLDRYALTIFPLWMVAGAYVAERGWTRRVVGVSAGLLAFYTFQFASWAFVA